MNITRPFLKTLRPQIEAALAPLAEKLKLDLKLGSATFDDANATFKLNVSTLNKDGSVNTPQAEDFKLYAEGYGLKAEMLNTEINIDGDVYEIVGCKPRSRKYPILAKQKKNGKTYKFSAFRIKSAAAQSA